MLPESRLAVSHVTEDLKRQMRRAAGALLLVSILQVLGGILVVSLVNAAGEEVPPILYLSVFGVAAVFFGLFLWARRNPFPAAIVGLVLYVTLLAVAAAANPLTILDWLLNALIVAILISAIGAGQKYRNIERMLSSQP
jgi:hypothetical protein